MRINRVVGLLALGMVGISSSVHAQVVSYFTTGQFTSATSTCNTAEAFEVVCSGAGPILTFDGAGLAGPTPLTVLAPTSALFGNFFLSGNTGTLTLNPGDVVFRLFIHQTGPTPGTATTVGSVTGSVVTVNGISGSTLIWQPTPQDMTIGAVNYHLVFDQGTQGFEIPAEQNKSINGKIAVTSTPEPASTALFATGLAGLIPMVIRRRKLRASR